MTIRSLRNGDPRPKPGTKVIYKGRHYYEDPGSRWYNKEVYVTDHPGDSNTIVVSDIKGEYHGQFCGSWADVVESPLGSLTEVQKTALSEAALAAANKRGYCSETKNILRDVGLPIPKKRRTVVVELLVEEEEGYSFYASNVQMRETDPPGMVKIIRAKAQ